MKNYLKKIFVAFFFFNLIVIWQNSFAVFPDFTESYFIGDSLTDPGNHNSPLTGGAAPYAENGEIWANVFADLIGTNSILRSQNYLLPLLPNPPGQISAPTKTNATNYAFAGGDTSSAYFQVMTLLRDKSVLTQTQLDDISSGLRTAASQNDKKLQVLTLSKAVLNSSEKLDGKAIYTYWAGSNSHLNLGDPVNPATYRPGSADFETAVNTSISAINLLRLAGAENITVFLLPDFAESRAAMIMAVNGDVTLSKKHNDELVRRIKELNYPILVIDTPTLFKNVKKNSAKFGYANENELLGSDFLHPTGRSHKIIAQAYAYNYLSPPRTINSMYTTTSDIIKNIDQGISQQLERSIYTEPRTEVFVFGQLGYQKSATVDENKSKGIPSNITAGIKHTISSNFSLGAAISQHQKFSKQPDSGSSFWVIGQTMSGFFGLDYKYGFFRTNVQLGRENFSSINRNFRLADADITMEGNTVGWYTSANMQGGIHYTISNIQFGPIFDLQTSQIRINPYTEKESTGIADSLNLDIHRQKSRLTLAGIGGRVAYRLQNGLTNYLINAKVSHFFTLDKHDTSVDYNLSTLPGTTARFSIRPNEAFMKFEANIAYSPISKDAINLALGYTFVKGKFSTVRNFVTLSAGLAIA